MRRLGRLVVGRHWEVSGSSVLLQRARRVPGSCVLDDFALRRTWRNFVRASLLNDEFRECSGSTSVNKCPERDGGLGSSVVLEEGDDESDEEEEEDKDKDEEEEEEEESIPSEELSEEDSYISSDLESDEELKEDMGLSEAEARLSGTDEEESGDEQLDAELEEAGKLLADENDETNVQMTKKKKKSYVHKLTIEDVSKVLEKLRPINLKILNVQERCEWADYMVFVTGRSTRHIRGMADMIVSAVKKKSTQDKHNLFPTVEGRESEDWMLVDCGNIIIHVFSEEARGRYNLEAKWSGAEVLQIGDGEGDGEETGSEETGNENEGVA